MSRRGGLFRKYVFVFVTLVTAALLASGIVEIWFSYGENKASLLAVQNEQAVAAAARIEAFVKEIERQMAWTTQPQLVGPEAAIMQRRIDFVRLQKQVPAITELAYLDATGREQLLEHRLAMSVVGSGTDFSHHPKFREARRATWFGPVYFRKESEPYMTIAMPVSGGGVTVAEVNLKFIWDVVSQIKVGKAGRAFVVDGQGQLIAHPDISLVLQKTSLASLPQVRAALAAPPAGGGERLPIATDNQGRDVLTSYTVIAPLRWAVFVEQPLQEAFAPLRASITRTAVLVCLGIGGSLVASVLLVRRMVRPIHTLQEGAARIGAGELGSRLEVRTGDELEALAGEFNRMTERLQESYATLERRVEERTRELSETLEQQTATAEILRVISSSPTDVQPVFDAIVRSALRLCEGLHASLFRFDGQRQYFVAHDRVEPETVASLRERYPRPPDPTTITGRALIDGQVIHLTDLRADERFVGSREITATAGYRAALAVPMTRDADPLGVIFVVRREPRPFTDKQIALVKTFSDQAVIAIENVRLFTELQEKNRAVTEALEQQTATADILGVISSSPTDVQPVFEAIVQSGLKLFPGAAVSIAVPDGDVVRAAAVAESDPARAAAWRSRFPFPLTREYMHSVAILERRVVDIPDVEDAPPALAAGRQNFLGSGYRGVTIMPMIRGDEAIGALSVVRVAPGPLSEKQVAVLRTFADQAVIAIENVRLFTELQEKNRAVTEALEQQTATAEILRVISGAHTDPQPVFEAIVRSAARLCNATISAVFRTDGTNLYHPANYGGSATNLAAVRAMYPRPLDMDSTPGRAILTRSVVHVADTEDPSAVELVRRTGRMIGFRSVVTVPMVHGAEAVGAITVGRAQPSRFSEAEVDLLKTFADQAVIAIENVRLFTALQERTRDLGRSVDQLTALGEVSRAVSSTLDLDRVLNTVVGRASELAGADGCSIYEYDEAAAGFRVRATSQLSSELVDTQRAAVLHAGEGAVGRLIETREPVQIPDIAAEHAYESPLRDALLRESYRALLAVPMLHEDRVVGGLVVSRKAPGNFPAETVELLKTFANQSALAIQNARLFREIEQKSAELEVANRHKSEFLASMSHELRTPLNAVIGFSEVLLERMFGDVNEKQEEYLRDIYSSGRHLLSLINDILDLAKIEAGRMELDVAQFDLPQAIENAVTLVRGRADAHGIRLEMQIAARLGDFVGDERKVKQILLNLLSNAVKFTPEGGRITLSATPANGSVEISVSDTGIGIAPEDQAAVFEEFRQVGTDYARKREGTGLGLALTKRFVELHGGAIWLKSAPDEGSTFTFTLPVRLWPTSSS